MALLSPSGDQRGPLRYGVRASHLYSITCYAVNFISSPTGHCHLPDKLFLLPGAPFTSLFLWPGLSLQISMLMSPRGHPRVPIALLHLLPNKPPSPVSQSAGSWKRGRLGCGNLTQGDLLLMAGHGETIWSSLWQQEGGDSKAQFVGPFVHLFIPYTFMESLLCSEFWLGPGATSRNNQEPHFHS